MDQFQMRELIAKQHTQIQQLLSQQKSFQEQQSMMRQYPGNTEFRDYPRPYNNSYNPKMSHGLYPNLPGEMSIPSISNNSTYSPHGFDNIPAYYGYDNHLQREQHPNMPSEQYIPQMDYHHMSAYPLDNGYGIPTNHLTDIQRSDDGSYPLVHPGYATNSPSMGNEQYPPHIIPRHLSNHHYSPPINGMIPINHSHIGNSNLNNGIHNIGRNGYDDAIEQINESDNINYHYAK